MRILSNTNYNFLRWRWQAIAASVVLIAAGIATMIAQGGPRLGIDFTGGTALELKFAQPVTEDAIRAALRDVPGEAVVQTIGDPGGNEILIRLKQTVAQEQADNIE